LELRLLLLLLHLPSSLHEIHAVVILEIILIAAIIVVEIIIIVWVIVHTLVKLSGIVRTIVWILIDHCPIYYLGGLIETNT
jgi:hypothetical protein